MGKRISTTEAARRIGISRRRVIAIANDGSGRLKATMVGNSFSFDEGQVTRFAELDRGKGRPKEPGSKPRNRKPAAQAPAVS